MQYYVISMVSIVPNRNGFVHSFNDILYNVIYAIPSEYSLKV